MKSILSALLLITCFQMGQAQMCVYSLNKMEVTDKNGKVEEVPILNLDNKEITHELIISGLGTDRITALGSNYGLAIETQLFPIDKPTLEFIAERTDKAQWYYTLHDQGVVIISIEGDIVKLHNLGLVRYVYKGKRIR